MGGPAPLPAGIDPNRPSPARIYDCLLGGTHNFAADRAVAARAVELVPELPAMSRANRAFLGRAVRFAAARGVRQFLDLGSGIPAVREYFEVNEQGFFNAWPLWSLALLLCTTLLVVTF